ncbi:hypothetical protein SLA2020_173460 [Shorea laevis]
MYAPEGREMMVDSLPPHQQHQLMLADSSGGEDQEVKAPKKRAETWVQDETRTLISLRREVDGLFNTSKSNKHLWEQISGKMRDSGFDRSPTMCTDKWRNLLKEFKKARYQRESGGGGPLKMSCYMEIEELLRCRTKQAAANSANYKNQPLPSCVSFSEKGFEDINIPFGPIEATDRSTVNLEQRLDHDGDPLAITSTTEAVGGDGVSPWSWRDTSGNGGEDHSSYCGRVISVKYGDFTKRIGVDGAPDAIKEAIKSAFRLRTKRAFWLEDAEQVVRSLDRDMPLGNYTLQLDEGITIKLCLYSETERIAVGTEDKTLYTEDDLRDFLSRRGWTGLRELNGYRCIDTLDDLQSGAVYQGVRLLGD